MKPIKVDKKDKKIFKIFSRTRFPLRNNNLCEEIYFYLDGYVIQILRFRSKGIYVYGFSKIELHQEIINDYLACANQITDSKEKEEVVKYLELAKLTASKLNKYIVAVEDPVYMRIMKNYDFMKKTLRDVPWFHDAYVVNCTRNGNDVSITFALYASSISRENTRIYKLNPKYRGEKNQILITIKFVNVELLKGSFEKEYMTNENYNFLWDLEYETISDIKHKFNLFSIQACELIFTCEYIEFVEAQ